MTVTENKLLIRSTIAVWAIIYLALCARTLVIKVDHHSVFPVFTGAAENWMNGRQLYVRSSTEEFRYSPLIAAFFVPFDVVPLKIGEFLWRSLNFAAFIGGLLCCCFAGIPRKFSRNEIAVVFLLTIPLSIGSLNNAQSNPLVLGLLLIAIAAVMWEQWFICTIAITIATCFKLYPIALGMLLMLYFPWKIGWRLLVCLAAAMVLPFVMQHAGYVMQQYAVWARYLSTEDRQRGPITDWYRDFRGLWRVYVMPMSLRQYLVVELATAAAIAGICLLGRLGRWPSALLMFFTLSLACCWMTAMGPATESATYILLAPIVAWTLVMSAQRPEDRPWRIAYGIVFGLFLASQLALNIHGRIDGKYFRDHLQPLPLAATLLLLILSADAIRHIRRNKPA